MNAFSRALFTSAFRFVLVTLLACVLLAGSALVVASLLAYLQSGDWNQPAYLVTGLCCGLVVWLFVAIFHLRHETQDLPISQAEQFLVEAKAIFVEMGYALVSQQGHDLSFCPNFHAFLFGGGIRLELDGAQARLTGPRVSLEIFRRLYRLQHHVQRVQKVLNDHRKFTENLLKRVELRLRLKPNQFEAVQTNVIALLQKNSSVVCELNLLAQSEHGFRENLVEFQIREWLREQNIPCDIHKDFVQFIEVVHAEPELELATV